MPKINIPSYDDEDIPALITLPDKPSPAIILIHDIYGISNDVLNKCSELASNGYTMICPDLFWRIEPETSLDETIPEQKAHALQIQEQFNILRAISDLKSVLNFLRNYDSIRGKIACLGYGTGGNLSFRMACESTIDASISYYPTNIEEALGISRNIQKPHFMQLAEYDEYIGEHLQEKVKLHLMPNNKITIHTHEKAKHGFAKKQAGNYKADAALLGRELTIEFLEKMIKE